MFWTIVSAFEVCIRKKKLQVLHFRHFIYSYAFITIMLFIKLPIYTDTPYRQVSKICTKYIRVNYDRMTYFLVDFDKLESYLNNGFTITWIATISYL